MEIDDLVGRDIRFLPGVEDFESYPETGMKATVIDVRPYPEDGLFEVSFDYTKFEADNRSFETLRYRGSDGRHVTFRQRDGRATPEPVRRFHTNFTYQAGSWTKPRRVIAKVEWHPDELVPRVGSIVTNLSRPAERVVAFYDQRGTAEQWIKEGKGAIKWTRLSYRTFAADAVRLQLHALACNLDNFLRTLATPEPIKDWSLTNVREKLIEIGARLVRHGRYVAFQMAEVAVPRMQFAEILRLIAELRQPPDPAPA
jgi:hypothetical protein